MTDTTNIQDANEQLQRRIREYDDEVIQRAEEALRWLREEVAGVVLRNGRVVLREEVAAAARDAGHEAA